MNTFKITKEEAGERIDKFLDQKIKEKSRSQIQKLIKNGFVLVNEKQKNPNYKLKEGEKIKIKETNKLINEKKLPKKEKKANIKNLKIIKETKDFLVINKPAGLVVHGADFILEETLVDILLKKYPEIKKVGDDAFRPGIVHRLDKEVSGLMVVARNQKSFENLKKQFQKRTVNKKYSALVYEQLAKESDTITFPIKRSAQGYRMAAIPNTHKKKDINLSEREAKEAITNFKVLKKFINYTLLKVEIKTGRTHQIRVHMSAYGHPIVGDDLYGTKKTKELNKKINMERIFLVADYISFKNLKKENEKFSLPMPSELKNLLKKIK